MKFTRNMKRIAFAGISLAAAAHICVLLQGILPAPRTITMTQRALAGETLSRETVKLSEVSPYLIAAVIAAEDARFCSHHGIDREAIEKAIAHNKKGGKRRGGSTITQQTAKNLFFWNGGGMARKAGEAYTALLIDAAWPKTKIMEHYLNIAEWGGGIFGAEAAAQARFGKPASALNAYEAALLASVLPSPNKWRIDPPSAFVSGRARTINARLKVIAREGFGDCVLSSHPGFNRNDFGAPNPSGPNIAAPQEGDIAKNKAKPDAKAVAGIAATLPTQAQPESTDAAPAVSKNAPEDDDRQNQIASTNSAPPQSLEEVLSAAETALENRREDMPAVNLPKDIRPPHIPPQERTYKTESSAKPE